MSVWLLLGFHSVRKRETCFASEMQFLGIRCSFQNNKYLVKVTVSEKVALGTLTAYVK